MQENREKVNILIRNKVIKLINKKGIKRISPKVIDSIGEYIKKNVEGLLETAKQEMIINGEKILKPQHLKSAIQKTIQSKEKNTWEI